MIPFTSQLRGDHTAVLLNDKIYFNGGNFSFRPQSTSVFASGQLFYLDVSKSFSIDDVSSMRGQTFLHGAGGSFLNVYDTTTQIYSTSSNSENFSTKRTQPNVPCVALNGYNPNGSSTSGIYLLDISQEDNYKWVTTFNPTTVTPISNSSSALSSTPNS
ncbi:16597_t:CDS:2 [Dentiscutata heterogama]|uniref:16597_t:CDS:1 n=1 Tax=Dentiscutata heterogama TaxID=1316150 RepID=A0ACA9KCK2_9GLOM|nr:16597_t:CDS:2 [Dentiscutata heterogama]